MLNDLLSGLVCGLIMGTIVLGVMIYMVASTPDFYERLTRRLPPNLPPTVFMLFIVIIVPPAWGLFGAVAGFLYNMAEEFYPDSGLGSSNFTFTLAILILSLLLTFITPLFRKKLPLKLSLPIILTLAGLFGWILPLLANWR